MTRGTFIDVGDELVEVPWADIQGDKERNDGSWNFTLVGGLHHDMTIRVYPPCDRIVFPGETPSVYEISPPIKQQNVWCYVHNPLGDAGPMKTTRMIRKVENGFGSSSSTKLS